MTYEEALQRLIEFMSNTQKDSRYYRSLPVIIACREALEKQVPTRVRNKDLLGSYRGITIYYGECPTCRKAIGSASSEICCDRCGQFLDWN